MMPQEKTQDNKNDSTNYSKATQSKKNITRDQAILIDTLVDATHEEYILALSEVVPASKIRFSSRIANNRICVYLDSKQTVDEIIDSKRCIVIGHQIIAIRPYVTRNKRIVFSNVHPLIDDSLLETELKKINVKIMSPIMSVRNGFSSKLLSHIISFRRQVYIEPDDLSKIPSRISIDLDDTNFWIYLSSDSTACFDCKQEGHIAKNCPNRSNLSTNNVSLLPDNEQLETKTTDSSKQSSPPKVNFPSLPPPSNLRGSTKITTTHTSNPTHSQDPKTGNQIHKNKRPPPSSTTSTSMLTDDQQADSNVDDSASDVDSIVSESSENTPKNNKHSTKKIKTDPSSAAKQEENWRQIEQELALNEKNYPLTSLQMQSLFDLTKGSQNIVETVLEHTTDLNGLMCMLTDLYPSFLSRSLKNRCTRIRNKIKDHLQNCDPEISQNFAET